ncbi:hypothetical protein TWF506_002102 [Arthrobotrys conoides]|uniref:Uncharacterized protein n=1 Tax=Arthrobotrys conoides TaxID=74498 RepID=A0AAN8NUD4_9PEZI
MKAARTTPQWGYLQALAVVWVEDLASGSRNAASWASPADTTALSPFLLLASNSRGSGGAGSGGGSGGAAGSGGAGAGSSGASASSGGACASSGGAGASSGGAGVTAYSKK